MTVASDGSATSPDQGERPGLDDIVDAARKMMFGSGPDASAAEKQATTQADLAAVDALAIDSINALLAGQHDILASRIATISDQHHGEGVNRAINVLCTIANKMFRHHGQPEEDEVVINAIIHPDLAADDRALLLRSARLAGDFLSATFAHDGARLAVALDDMRPDTFDPVLSMLASYVAGMLAETDDDARARLLTVPDLQLCPTAGT